MESQVNVLFLCTHNSARSILAEAWLNHIGAPRFKAYSAGSMPRANQAPHPLALQVLKASGVSIDGLHSKCWDIYGKANAPLMDLIITVCDKAAGEPCPEWPGRPATDHWGYPDPSEGNAPDAKKILQFQQTLQHLMQRLQNLVHMNKEQIRAAVFATSASALLT